MKNICGVTKTFSDAHLFHYNIVIFLTKSPTAMRHLFHFGTRLKNPLREKLALAFRNFTNRFFVFLIPHRCRFGDVPSVTSVSQNQFLHTCCFHISLLWCSGLKVTIIDMYVSSTVPKSLPILSRYSSLIQSPCIPINRRWISILENVSPTQSKSHYELLLGTIFC
jgi:hypothetical protein